MDPEALRDLFASLGPIRTRRMFGGQGIYRGEAIFAIEVNGEIFLKVDDENRSAFEQAGSRPFSYAKADGSVATMSYWHLPDAALDDPDEAARWGRMALDASARAAGPRRVKKKR